MALQSAISTVVSQHMDAFIAAVSQTHNISEEELKTLWTSASKQAVAKNVKNVKSVKSTKTPQSPIESDDPFGLTQMTRDQLKAFAVEKKLTGVKISSTKALLLEAIQKALATDNALSAEEKAEYAPSDSSPSIPAKMTPKKKTAKKSTKKKQEVEEDVEVEEEELLASESASPKSNPGAVKKKLTAYNVFVQETREKVKMEIPDAPVKDVTKRLSEMSDVRYIVIDFETTGVGEDRGRPYKKTQMPLPRANWPVELGAISIDENGNVLQKIYTTIKGAKRMNPWVEKNCPNVSVSKCESEGVEFSEALDMLATLIGDSTETTIVSHNIQYDWDMVIQTTVKELGLNESESFRKLNTCDCFCTMVNSKTKADGSAYYWAKIGRWIGPKLSDLTQKFNIDYDNGKAHDALYDATLAAKCLCCYKSIEFCEDPISENR